MKVVGFVFCGCGCLLAVIAIAAVALSWHSAADKATSWTVADKKEFNFECKDNNFRIVKEILLFREKTGDCTEQFKHTTVTFSPNGTQSSKEVALISNCTQPANASGANSSGRAVEFMARRLGVTVGGWDRGQYEGMASFKFLNETDHPSECALGTYTVKSDNPLWAISLVDNVLPGMIQIIGGLLVFVALCGVGVLCACVGGCILACSD